jgi:flagellar hook-basal body complex protein FliE
LIEQDDENNDNDAVDNRDNDDDSTAAAELRRSTSSKRQHHDDDNNNNDNDDDDDDDDGRAMNNAANDVPLKQRSTRKRSHRAAKHDSDMLAQLTIKGTDAQYVCVFVFVCEMPVFLICMFRIRYDSPMYLNDVDRQTARSDLLVCFDNILCVIVIYQHNLLCTIM